MSKPATGQPQQPRSVKNLVAVMVDERELVIVRAALHAFLADSVEQQAVVAKVGPLYAQFAPGFASIVSEVHHLVERFDAVEVKK